MKEFFFNMNKVGGGLTYLPSFVTFAEDFYDFVFFSLYAPPSHFPLFFSLYTIRGASFIVA